MLTTIRIFHEEDIRAGVRAEDGVLSGLSDVTQEARKGCVLSPQLLNVLFAAVLHVVLVHFSQNEAIVRDLVQLNDVGVVGTEDQEPVACVRRAVWGMHAVRR